MPALRIEIPPAAEPVTLAQTKSHLRVSISDDDVIIQGYIQAARENVEAFLSRSLINKGYRQCLDSFPYYTDALMSRDAYPPSFYSLPRYSATLWNYSQIIKLFRSPLVAVSRISYLSSGDSQWHDLLPQPARPRYGVIYVVGQSFKDPNGNQQTVTAVTESEEGGASISGATDPAWGNMVGATTTWGDLTLSCGGPAPAGDFIVDADREPPRIFPLPGQCWPSVLYVPEAVEIHYLAGYGNDGANVPAVARIAVMQQIGNYYEHRETTSPASLREVPALTQNLLWGLRVVDFAPTRG